MTADTRELAEFPSRVAEVVDGNAEDLAEHLSKVVDGLLAAMPTNSQRTR